MNFRQRERNTLVIRYIPWGTWLLIILTLGFTLTSAFFRSRLVTLDCTRTIQQPSQGQCILTRFDWQGKHQQRWPLDQITGATQRVISSSRMDVYAIDLIISQQRVKTPIGSDNLQETQRQVKQIQELLTKPQPNRLFFRDDSRLTWLLIGLFLIFCSGIWAILAGEMSILRLDQRTGQLRLFKCGVFWTEVVEYPLSQVVKALVTGSGNDSSVVIVLKVAPQPGAAPRSLWLHLHPLLALHNRQRSCQRTAQRILDFLHADDR